MGPSLVARSIQALDDLRAALTRFSQDSASALSANDGEIHRAENYLAQRERHWQGEVRNAEAELQRALDALRSCQAYAAQAAQSGQGRVSCDREAAAVQAAQAHLAQMQRNLAEARRIAMQLHNEIGVYQQSAQRMRTTATTDAPRAAAWLARHITSLREATATGPSGIGSIVGGTVSALGGLAAGALGAAFGATAASGAQPHSPASSSASPAPMTPAPAHSSAAVEALQARVDALRASDAAAQQRFDAENAAAPALATDAPLTPVGEAADLADQGLDAHIPPSATPEASPATEADHEREGPPGDPRWRV